MDVLFCRDELTLDEYLVVPNWLVVQDHRYRTLKLILSSNFLGKIFKFVGNQEFGCLNLASKLKNQFVQELVKKSAKHFEELKELNNQQAVLGKIPQIVSTLIHNPEELVQFIADKS